MGPRGLPGEIGRTEHIAIDETETLEPGEEAQVMDTFEDWVHHLTFQIPKKENKESKVHEESRPSRTTRNQFCISIWNKICHDGYPNYFRAGYRYHYSISGNRSITFTEYTNNGVKIKESGVYLISYLLCGATSEECSLTMSIKANDILQPASNPTIEFQAQIINCISGTTIISLQPDDIVTLNIKASMPVTMTFNGSTNAMLSVLKIH